MPWKVCTSRNVLFQPSHSVKHECTLSLNVYQIQFDHLFCFVACAAWFRNDYVCNLGLEIWIAARRTRHTFFLLPNQRVLELSCNMFHSN